MEKQIPDLPTFLQNFEAQFEEEEKGVIRPDTQFRELEEWSSMHALVVMASFDWDYGVTLSAEEIRGAKTVEDLFLLVCKKLS